MQTTFQAQSQARHARLFELIRQQNLVIAQDAKRASEAAELNDAQSFITAAHSSLRLAG